MKLQYKLALSGTVLMTLICMAVSYGTMYEVAMMHQIPAAELFPIAIDGSMALAMFVRVYFSKIGKPSRETLLIMGFFTLTSILVNAVAAQNALEIYLFSIAPIGVFSSTELSALIIEKQPVEKKPRKPTRAPNGKFTKEVE